MKRIITIIILATCALWAQASEAWLNTLKFVYQPGETAKVSFHTGDNLIGAPWQLTASGIQKLELHQQTGVSDLKPTLKTDSKENLEINFPHEGSPLITLETTPIQITHTADQFNEYLKAEGLDEIAYNREQAGAAGKPATEQRVQYVKLALQVGANKDHTSQKAIGFPLELIPHANPYNLTKGQTLKFTIQWKGKPWFGARVKILNREDSRTTIQNLHTGKDGTVEIIISNTGPWMLCTTIIEPSKESGIQWQSYQSCYTFGVQ